MIDDRGVFLLKCRKTGPSYIITNGMEIYILERGNRIGEFIEKVTITAWGKIEWERDIIIKEQWEIDGDTNTLETGKWVGTGKCI